MGPWMLVAAPAVAADFETLLSDDGWEVVESITHKELGPVEVRLKTIDGERCLMGQAVTPASAKVLYEVVTDIPAAKAFSSETLLAAEVLGRDGDTLHYYQHLDVPGWTMAADRFWVLAGRPASSGETVAFRWQRFDWRTAYPELSARLNETYPGAVEPNPNWGSWVFTPADGGTRARYYLCSDPGGSLPKWLERAAATKTLPNTMGDVIREARRRGGG